jgi:hypothetical protein
MISETLLVWAGIAAAGASLLLALLVSLGSRPRRPSPAPASADLGPESPAVVNLLTNRFEVSTEAMPATLLDLAARRWIDVDWIGEQTLLRPRSRGQGTLSRYEVLVLDHVKGLARDGVVPAEALTTGPQGASKRWWRRFAKTVIADARERRLCRPRWGKGITTLLSGGIVVSGLILALIVPALRDSGVPNPSPASDLELGIAAGVTLLLLLVAGRLSTSLKQRDTDAGLEAAGRWLGLRAYLAQNDALAGRPAAAVIVWDQYMAYAAALGLAPTAVRDLPLGAEDDRRAWSRATGQWRQVRVRYPSLRVGWGLSPLGAIGRGLLRGIPLVVVLWFAVHAAGGAFAVLSEIPGGADVWTGIVPLAVIGVATLLLAWQVALVSFGFADAVNRRQVEGVVLRRRVFHEAPWAARLWGAIGFRSDEVPTETGEDASPPRYWLAVDDGSALEVTAWRVDPGAYWSAEQGSRVRVEVTPRLGHLKRLEMLASPPERAPASITTVAEEVLRGAVPLPPALLGRVEERLRGMTDPEGRAVLEQLEAAGVPLRQRLSRTQDVSE